MECCFMKAIIVGRNPSFLYQFFFIALQAVVSFVTMQFQLCTVFFTFSLGTKTHYFGRTILHGGARVCLQTLCPLFLNFPSQLLISLFVNSIKQLAVGLLSAISNFQKITDSTHVVILLKGEVLCFAKQTIHMWNIKLPYCARIKFH